ncbi:hypothetical protein C0J52_16023, partial [Blattella germanica]
ISSEKDLKHSPSTAAASYRRLIFLIEFIYFIINMHLKHKSLKNMFINVLHHSEDIRSNSLKCILLCQKNISCDLLETQDVCVCDKRVSRFTRRYVFL